MRLLNTASITLRDFIGGDIPPYAILSHTWETEEVLLADVLNGTAKSKKGYDKIRKSCIKAADNGFEWIWIDTCCIDKTSSAELSEAINSMYRYYALSTICYAYLQDVTIWPERKPSKEEAPVSKVWGIVDFTRSRWFTRGWTLQELIAPKVVEFYSREWKEIGTKASLARTLSVATGILTRVIHGESIFFCSSAVRMSWASARQTTRLEDMAYCLLGLFNVNMPLLYGEGQKAFVRLQEQILRQQEDYSLFTWTLQEDCGDKLTGLLASTPHEFAHIVPKHLQQQTLERDALRFGTGAAAAREIWSQTEEFLRPETFKVQFGITSEKYDVLYDKDYNGLSRYNVQRTKARFAPRQPPVLTSRGLLLTLPVFAPHDPTMPTLAWVYCVLNSQLLCIAFRPCSDSSRLHGRFASPWLIAVDWSLVRNFHIEEIWMHPNGLIYQGAGPPGTLTMPTPTTESDSRLGRVRFIIKDSESCSCSITKTLPIERWVLDEFFFEGSPDFIGMVVFECRSEYGGRRVFFTIQCGIQNEHPWCVVNEFETLEDSNRQVKQLPGTLPQKGPNPGRENKYPFSDRSVCLSKILLDTVITAAVRRTPAAQHDAHMYVLEVGAQPLDESEPWMHRLGLQTAEEEMQEMSDSDEQYTDSGASYSDTDSNLDAASEVYKS